MASPQFTRSSGATQFRNAQPPIRRARRRASDLSQSQIIQHLRQANRAASPNSYRPQGRQVPNPIIQAAGFRQALSRQVLGPGYAKIPFRKRQRRLRKQLGQRYGSAYAGRRPQWPPS